MKPDGKVSAQVFCLPRKPGRNNTTVRNPGSYPPATLFAWRRKSLIVNPLFHVSLQVRPELPCVLNKTAILLIANPHLRPGLTTHTLVPIPRRPALMPWIARSDLEMHAETCYPISRLDLLAVNTPPRVVASPRTQVVRSDGHQSGQSRCRCSPTFRRQGGGPNSGPGIRHVRIAVRSEGYAA
jgi:hypothetical protein